MQKRQLSGNSQLYYGGGSYCQSTVYAGGVIVSVARGPQLGELATFIIEEGAEQLRTFNRCFYFVDAYESSMMTSEFRERMTDWFRLNKGRVSVDMLIRSKLLEMALNVANLVIGDGAARAHSNVARWEEAVAKKVPGFRRQALQIPADLL